MRTVSLVAVIVLALGAGGSMSALASSASVGAPAAGPASARPTPLMRLASDSRVRNCNVCCAGKQAQCLKSNSRELCDTEYQNCIATCTSEGSTATSWGSACWASAGG